MRSCSVGTVVCTRALIRYRNVPLHVCSKLSIILWRAGRMMQSPWCLLYFVTHHLFLWNWAHHLVTDSHVLFQHVIFLSHSINFLPIHFSNPCEICQSMHLCCLHDIASITVLYLCFRPVMYPVCAVCVLCQLLIWMCQFWPAMLAVTMWYCPGLFIVSHLKNPAHIYV